jgi:N-acetylated-alpha-linked acidic dipeptidase
MAVVRSLKIQLTGIGFVIAILAAALGAAPAARAGGGIRSADSTGSLLGFSTDGAARQHALEARFDSLLRRDEMREWMRRMTAHPHHLGSPHDRQNAEFMAGLLRSWG